MYWSSCCSTAAACSRLICFHDGIACTLSSISSSDSTRLGGGAACKPVRIVTYLCSALLNVIRIVLWTTPLLDSKDVERRRC